MATTLIQASGQDRNSLEGRPQGVVFRRTIFERTISAVAASEIEVDIPAQVGMAGHVIIYVEKTAGSTNVDEINFDLAPLCLKADGSTKVVGAGGYKEIEELKGNSVKTKKDFSAANSYFDFNLTALYALYGDEAQYFMGSGGHRLKLSDQGGDDITATFYIKAVVR